MNKDDLISWIRVELGEAVSTLRYVRQEGDPHFTVHYYERSVEALATLQKLAEGMK